MAATAAQVYRLRQMCAATDISAYTDYDLTAAIESHPLLDSEGREPTHDDWVATYDLHAAATDVWQEKAAALAAAFDFSADGASYTRSQQYAQALSQMRYHNARRAAVGVPLMTTYTTETDLPTA